MQLTRNFTLHELTRSETADRNDIDNTPTNEVICNLRLLCEKVLQPIRTNLGRTNITSGFRGLVLNTKIGGARNSDHLYGFAADIWVDSVSNYELGRWIAENLQFKQLILEYLVEGQKHRGWIHVSYDERNLKNQILKINKGTGYVPYTYKGE